MAQPRVTTPKKNMGKLGDYSPIFEGIGRATVGAAKYGGALLQQGLTGIPSTTVLGEVGKNFKGTSPAQKAANAIVNPGEQTALDMADSMTDDTATVEDSYSSAGGVGLGPKPTLSMPMPTPFSDPTQGGMNDIISELQSQKSPLERAVPEPLSPLATFLASFGASMATSVTRNPAILENAQRRIADLEQRRQAIVEQNRLDEISFNQSTHQQVMSLRLSALQKQYEEALASNSAKDQVKALEAITKYQEEVKMWQTQAQEAGDTARTKLTVGKGTKQDGPKQISMKELQDQLGTIAGLDPQKTPTGEAAGWFGEKKNAMSKERSTLDLLAGAGLSGDSEEVKAFAQSRMKMSVGNLYGVDWDKPVNPRKVQQIGQMLVDYGYDKGVAMTILKGWMGK